MRKIYLEIVGMILCVMAGLAIGLHYTTHRFTIGQAIVVCFLLFIAAALTLRKARPFALISPPLELTARPHLGDWQLERAPLRSARPLIQVRAGA